jgi:hypothetical protein
MNVALQTKTPGKRATNRWSRILSLAALVFLIVALLAVTAPHAIAQGCAMCYQNAASSGAQGRAALRHGILILLLPALSLFLGVFFLIYRRRDPA